MSHLPGKYAGHTPRDFWSHPYLAQYKFKGFELEQLLHFFFSLCFHLININVFFSFDQNKFEVGAFSRKIFWKVAFSLDNESSTQIFEGHVEIKIKNTGHDRGNIMQGSEQEETESPTQAISKCQLTTSREKKRECICFLGSNLKS